MIENIIFLLIGALLGWGVQHLYAARGEKLLRQNHEEILRIVRAFADVVERQGLVKWTKDAEGRITFGQIVEISAHDEFKFGASGTMHDAQDVGGQK